MKVARHFIVRGEVQGVGYRFFAQRVAARHQVVGYVKNMPDGTVESLAEGSPQDVEGFKNDLAAGPRFARVERVEEKVIEPTGLYSSFRVER
ncbi:MAG TPA: acylphosphatase [Pyrinomonadaceae bacterium]|nr:acylphosphatase [Pyrinomonadaceae bacterium]